jgi:hypothetical protein
MPKLDGTGPRGQGPMTGQGRGYCLLKLPQKPNEPITGFAGRSGVPVRVEARRRQAEVKRLRAEARRVETAIRRIRKRLAELGALPQRPGSGR